MLAMRPSSQTRSVPCLRIVCRPRRHAHKLQTLRACMPELSSLTRTRFVWCWGSVTKAKKTTKGRSPVCVAATADGEAEFPDLPLFKQLATDLASLDKALVKIHASRQKSTGKVDESLLTTLIEEVQREQEAWFKQVQVMERLVEQATTLESSKTELDDLRQRYDDMRRKVDLYYGLLEEREREVDTLKQQLEDVNTAVELKERKNAALKELVVAGASTAQEEMGLPTWTPSEVSTFFVKDESNGMEKEADATKEVTETKPRSHKHFTKKIEVPGLAFVSILVLLTRLSGGVWDSTMSHVPKEIKALVEIAGLGFILITAASVASNGFM